MGSIFQPDDPPPHDGWMPMTMAKTYPPPTGEPVEIRYQDGTEEIGRWELERYCMLGAPQGSCGAGWVSVEAGNLPVQDVTHWRHIEARA